MELQQNVPLSQYSSMRLGGNARYLTEVKSIEETKRAVGWGKENNLPLIMIGSGCNIIWRDEGFPGLVMVNKITGFEVTEDEIGTYVNIGGGENWDQTVDKTVKLGLTGIECLSLIPGTAGATPVQNVGAYGQDISQSLVTVTAFDMTSGTMVTIPASDCNFAYRTSIFKTSPGKYFITNITLMLHKGQLMPPFYSSLAGYLEQHTITDYSAQNIRNAIIDIRSQKLPDPNQVANCGSFYTNPIVDRSLLSSIEAEYTDVPHWSKDDDKVKLSAAWLVEKAGYADFYDQSTGIATWPKQPLVFTNKSASSTVDLLRFSAAVQAKVKELFGVDLQIEPLLIP